MTKSRNLDFELFRKHLNKMIGIEGINQEEIKEATGLSNVSRYLSGKRIVNPKMRTWFLIHDAFPEFMPPPTLKGGEPVFENHSEGQSVVQHGEDVRNFDNRQAGSVSGDIIVTKSGSQLTTQESFFIEQLHLLKEPEKFLQRVTFELMQKIQEEGG